jgi:hypothetical protein
LTILRTSVEGGEAYFRLESTKSEEVLENLSSRVELTRVGEVLRLYTKALTGTNVSIQPTASLVEKGIGWVDQAKASTEGTTVFLPQVIEDQGDRDTNFATYKVYTTHQAGRLEFGSFRFRFDARGGVTGNHRARVTVTGHELPLTPGPSPEGRGQTAADAALTSRDSSAESGGTRTGARQAVRESGRGDAEDSGLGTQDSGLSAAVTDMERFFDLFPERQLASDIFTVVEDARVDWRIAVEYAGVRGSFKRVQRRELQKRRDVSRMPLRDGLLENLVRASLDGRDTIRYPLQYQEVMSRAIGLLNTVNDERANVQDSADVTIHLYQLALSVPNIYPQDMTDAEWEEMPGEMSGEPLSMEGGEEGGPQGAMQMGDVGEGEMDYSSPDDVDFRGDFKPELVQLLMKLRAEAAEQGAGQQGQMQLTPEQLQELLEKSTEINIDEFMQGDLSDTTGMFLSNLMKEAGTPTTDANQQDKGQPTGENSTPGGEGEDSLVMEVVDYYYDEWDFRAQDYKPRWCRVKQQVLQEGTDEFFNDTLKEHAGLVAQTRKQFEMLRPEMFRKIRRLPDGEDFDLDAVIEFIVEKKAGANPSDKLYWRRNKIERDVSVAFLIDMSASTDEEINKRDRRQDDDDFDDDPRKYLSWWVAKRRQEMMTPPKRIIDLEKESTVLLIKALETIGDEYGIFGFSGYGRESFYFFFIK